MDLICKCVGMPVVWVCGRCGWIDVCVDSFTARKEMRNEQKSDDVEYAAYVVEPDVSSDEHNNAFESDDSSTEGF